MYKIVLNSSIVLITPIYITLLMLLIVGLIFMIYQFVIFIFGVVSYLGENSEIQDPEFDDLISIIVPVKNEERTIGKCLESIINQSYKKIEVIVVEDGSNDKSYDICKKYESIDERIKCYHRDLSNGKPSALNFGLERAHGSIIAVFDADSVLDKDNVLNALTIIKTENLDALQGENIVIDKKGFIPKSSKIDQIMMSFSLEGREKLGLFKPLNGSNQYIRRDLLKELGPWSEIHLTEDLEFAMRANFNDKKVAYSKLVRCEQHPPSTVRAFIKQRKRWFRGYYQILFGKKNFKYNSKGLDAGFILLSPLVFALMFYSGIALIFLALFYGNSLPLYSDLFIIGLGLLLLNIAGFTIISLRNIKYLIYMPIFYVYWAITSAISIYSLALELFKAKRVWEKTDKA